MGVQGGMKTHCIFVFDRKFITAIRLRFAADSYKYVLCVCLCIKTTLDIFSTLLFFLGFIADERFLKTKGISESFFSFFSESI